MNVENQVRFATLLASLVREGKRSYQESIKTQFRGSYQYTIWILLEGLRRSDYTGYLVALRLVSLYRGSRPLTTRQVRNLKRWDRAIDNF